MKSATKQKADSIAAKRMVSSITVYILSSTKQHEDDIAFLFEKIPVRLLKFSITDFFTSAQMGLMTPSLMSAGQCAAMYASKKDYDCPVLLLTGGVAVTYIVMDKNRFFGFGAFPSIAIRCRTLFDYCSQDFPSIGFDKYKEITSKAKKEKKPLSLFSSSWEESTIANATAEMAGILRNIVKQFITTVSQPNDTSSAVQVPKVVITGDDSDTDFIVELLKENCSNLVIPEPDVKSITSSEDIVCVRKNMAAFGIQHVLIDNKKMEVPLDPDNALRQKIIGLRAAITSNHNQNIRRGTIVRVMPGKKFEEDTFVLTIVDGEDVCLDLVQLYDSMFLYAEVGEESKEQDKEDWVDGKRKASSKVQEALVEKNEKVKMRKVELESGQDRDGTVVNMLSSTGTKNDEQRGEKRPRPDEDLTKYIGQRIAKYFEMPDSNQLYFGKVDKVSDHSNQFLHIQYDDGDEEEFDFSEMRAGILLYAKQKNLEKNK